MPYLNSGSRRRKCILSVLVLISVCFAALLVFGKEAPEGNGAAPEIQKAEGKLHGLTIAVDAGHGGYDGGARAKVSGIWEKEINLSVALLLKSSLEDMGAEVVMTRDSDEDLATVSGSGKKRSDLSSRLKIADEAGAAMFLSIHMNEYRSAKESGPQVFFRAGSESSMLLAQLLQEALVNNLEPERVRVAMAGDYYVLGLGIPSVLIECGFISNPREEALLISPEYQRRLAAAVADGVAEFAKKQALS
ncbi:MAG: N-acetylmuramoyl-L-alanine amidase [Eubacteriales bacterium]|nr:N-acetylmuramoyl-L-alanine amidase [Eubacteriales bacterium]MDD3882158.1 N-acetylmuramoyl-L-alanine amidase [Eubacteriales bacterium]MDD4513263.1 N-acetylmuramoyl-L-alanine amidase [Eubacteriales bacterium]